MSQKIDDQKVIQLTCAQLKALAEKSYINGTITIVPKDCDLDMCECCTQKYCDNRKSPYDPMTDLSECDLRGHHNFPPPSDYWNTCLDCGYVVDLVTGRHSQ